MATRIQCFYQPIGTLLLSKNSQTELKPEYFSGIKYLSLLEFSLVLASAILILITYKTLSFESLSYLLLIPILATYVFRVLLAFKIINKERSTDVYYAFCMLAMWQWIFMLISLVILYLLLTDTFDKILLDEYRVMIQYTGYLLVMVVVFVAISCLILPIRKKHMQEEGNMIRYFQEDVMNIVNTICVADGIEPVYSKATIKGAGKKV